MNGFTQQPGGTWIFGPLPRKDNVFQCLPQVTLHGMDEGLTAKLCRGILALALHFGEQKGLRATQVHDVYVIVFLHIRKSTSYTYSALLSISEKQIQILHEINF
jgi:hypothetical protein